MNFKDFKKSIEEKLVFPFIDFLVFSNIWISLAAGSVYFLVNLKILGITIVSSGNFFVFFATLFAYNFLRYKSLNHQEFSKSPIAIWMINHILYVKTLMAISLFGVLFYFFQVIFSDFHLVKYFFASGLVLFIYAFGGLRKLWQLKSFVIVLVWLFSTTLLPFLEDGTSSFGHCSIILAHFFFMLALTLPFDIRDLKYDSSNEDFIKTIPMVVGEKNVRLISVLCLLFAGVFLAVFQLKWFFVSLPVMLLSALLISKLTSFKNEYYYTFLLDGMLFLYAFLLIFLV